MAEYRLNAGIVVFNIEGKVLLCRRKGWPDAWQFPQGGINEGETIELAAARELAEETSLSGLKLIKTLDYGVRYDFPPEIAKNLCYEKKHYAGQEMYWSLFYFDGNDSEINLHTAEPEFDAFRWGDLGKAVDEIIAFKRKAYQVAFDEFEKVIKESINLQS